MSDTHRIFRLLRSNTSDAFHSAVLTSYTFNGGYFEGCILPYILKAGVSSINLLLDAGSFEAALGPTTVNTAKLGSRYAVDTIHSRGAFHPKINLFIGSDKALLLPGSGNLTAGGQGKNIELFTGIYATAEMPGSCALIAEAWRYVCSFAPQLSDYSHSRLINDIAPLAPILTQSAPSRHSFRLIADGLDAALLYNDADSDIASQLERLIDADSRAEVVDICVISPFYDRDGACLLQLKDLFPAAKIRVAFASASGYSSGTFSRFPVELKHPEEFSFHTLKGRLGSGPLHAKVLIFKTPTTGYCLIGSANATTAAFGCNGARAINDEFDVLYRSKRDFEAELDLNLSAPIPFAHIIDKKRQHPDPSEFRTAEATIRLRGAEIAGRTCTLNLDEIPDGAELICLDSENIALARYPLTGLTIEIDAPGASFVRIVAGTAVSNTVPLLYSDKLFFTHPAKVNRSYTQLLLELDRDNPAWGKLDSTLCSIISELALTPGPSKASAASSSSVNKADTPFVQAEYDADFDLNGASAISPQTRRINRTIDGIADALCKALTANIENRRDESADQEEDASARRGHEYKIRGTGRVSVSPAKIYERLSASILRAFVKRMKAGVAGDSAGELNLFYGTMGFVSRLITMPLEREEGYTSGSWTEYLRRSRADIYAKLWPAIDLFARRYRRPLTPDGTAALWGVIAAGRRGLSESVDDCIKLHMGTLRKLIPNGQDINHSVGELYADSSLARAAIRLHKAFQKL